MKVLCLIGWHKWLMNCKFVGEGYWSYAAWDQKMGWKCDRCGKVKK